MHCPRAPTLEPSKGAPTQEPSHPNRNVKWPWCLVSCLCGFLFLARFPGSLSRSLCVSCLFFLPLSLSFFSPRASRPSSRMGETSGQTRGHRPKKRYRAPTQGPGFSGTPPRTTFLCTSSRLSCTLSSTLTFYFPRMLSLTTPIPSSVEQDKYFNPHRIYSIPWRSTGYFGWRRTLSIVFFTHRGS